MLENEIQKYTPLNRYFVGKAFFGDDGNQNFLIYQPMSRYLKFVTNSQNISSWRSKGLWDKEIKVVNGLYHCTMEAQLLVFQVAGLVIMY